MTDSVKSADLADARVLVRVDWNEPLSQRGEIQDDFKLRASLATIEYIRKKKPAAILLLAHLGSPVVRPGESMERTIAGNRQLVLQPLAERAAELLKTGQKVTVRHLKEVPLPVYDLGENIYLLENLRFHPGERSNDEAFAKQLAELGDVFVHEAFPEVHRTVASLCELPKFLPKYLGLRLDLEIETLNRVRTDPPKPFTMVLGGAKVADKAPLIRSLMKKADNLLLGGVLANTFMAANGIDVGKSQIEAEELGLAQELLAEAPRKFILPIDFEWERDRAVDLGQQTIELFERHIKKSSTVFWNGPVGWTASGKERYYRGSQAIARAMADTPTATTIAAGGDTLEVIRRYHLEKNVTFCSTGGGAAMAFLAGQELPGLALFLD